MRTTTAIAAAGLLVAAAGEIRGEDKAPAPRAAVDAGLPPAGVQWFATWDLASKEAARTHRPILLVAAAPHCHEISGLW